MEQAVEKPQTGMVTRQEFGATQMQRSAETAASAVAAQATAMIQARYVMALQRPRDLLQVRSAILKEVERPGFAESAYYVKPIGRGVEGLSVRFAETAMRCLGNMSADPMVVFEDDEQRIVRLLVTDLEANVTISKDIVVTKTVERSSLRQGQTAISVRTNSGGKTTYLVEATDDEVLAKENSLISKALRNAVLRMLPGDIQDEAKQRIKDIRAGEVAKNPDAAKKKIADSFAELGVQPAQLKACLGHDLATCSPAELVELRGVFSAIKAGEATWAEVMEGRTGEPQEKPAEEKRPGLAGVTEKLKAETTTAPAETKTAAPDPDADDAEKEPASIFDERVQAENAARKEERKAEREREVAACVHRSLWNMARKSKGTNPLACPDCDRDVPPMGILACADEAKGGKA